MTKRIMNDSLRSDVVPNLFETNHYNTRQIHRFFQGPIMLVRREVSVSLTTVTFQNHQLDNLAAVKTQVVHRNRRKIY